MSNQSAAELHDVYDIHGEQPTPEPLGLAPEPVEVRRNGGLAATLGILASAVAIAYLARAAGGGSWLDWALVVVMGGLGVTHLAAFVDARIPLLVADAHGVRIRLGRSWRGVPWSAVERVEHQPRRGPLRDGRLVLVATDPDAVLQDLDRSGRRQAAVARRLYGSPLATPLALSTVVAGADGDLTGALQRLAGDADRVVEVLPEPEPPDPEAEFEPEPEALPESDADVEIEESERPQRGPETAPAPQPVASPSPSPLRDPVTGARVEVRFEGALAADQHEEDDDASPDRPAVRQLRRPGSVDLVEDTVVWSDRVRPIAREGTAVEPLVLDDFDVEPADDPVVGPELAAARTRLSLTVDQLAERTRIRPHVIESIEVDDFAPCGGDFYARGHLRTLARVLGIDPAPLLASYDERYADAPINARRVFEADLATAADGPIRGTRGGPNWSVLVAAVMALVLAWSIARLIMDSPVELHSQPVLNGSGGAAGSPVELGPPVPVVLDASGGGTHVVVRDGAGDVVFNGDLAFGATRTVKASPPVRVQSSDGSLKITVDGDKHGALGARGRPAQNTFTVDG